MKIKSILTVTLMAVFAFGAVGCASQKTAKLESLYKQSQDQVLSLRQQLAEANARIKTLQNAEPGLNPQQTAQINQLKQQRDQLQAALKKAQAQLNAAGAATIMLPSQLNSELEKLAAQNPGLMTYDSKRGMIKLASDLTFALGSAKVNANAQSAIQKLAAVLNGSQASKYDVRIAGYTDNVPIERPSTKRKFPNNWYLSAGRAIAVEGVLQSAGVDPHRMGVAGYSKYRPIVPNGKKGAKQNRRVEIFIVPHVAVAAPAQSSATSSSSSSTTTSPDVYK